MATRPSSKMKGEAPSSCELFAKYFESRPDVGFRKMLLDIALNPRSPFKPWEPRKMKKGFAAAVLLLLFACVWFGYFSLTG